MTQIFNKTSDLVNTMIKINSSWIKITDEKLKKLPMSCKYFLTMLDISNDLEIKKFFSYMNDETRTIEFPFEKQPNIDYSMMLEMDQFYNIELSEDSSLKQISNNIDEFINIVRESNGKIVFVIDINYFKKFLIDIKNKSVPNHLTDLILYKLLHVSTNSENQNTIKITDIFILDKDNIVQNPHNLFYLQLKQCVSLNVNTQDINIDEMKQKIIKDKYIMVYKKTADSLIENVYWNILEPGMISEHIGKIKSPFESNSYFNLVKINDQECFVKKIYINECIEKNLFDLDKNPGIIIDPIDRLNT